MNGIHACIKLVKKMNKEKGKEKENRRGIYVVILGTKEKLI